MESWLLAPTIGLTLLVLGIVLIRSHLQEYHHTKEEEQEPFEQKHLISKFRRRLFTSGLIALLGIIIPIGDYLIEAKENPKLFTFFWGGVLLITFVVIMMGISDLFAIRAHTKISLARIERNQRALEKTLAKLKEDRNNGHS